ncbi:MAG: M1 family metallopeptidase [Rhodothermaceae bacterium]|nr:M1 family metallopeptidase [Rhodothermaceae bacterium]
MRLLSLVAAVCCGLLAAPVFAQYGDSANDSGGPLRPEQATFDVIFYDLHLAIRPESRSIEGVLEMHADIVAPTDVLVLDLDDALTVDDVTVNGTRSLDLFDPGTGMHLRATGRGTARRMEPFTHEAGVLRIPLGRTAQPGERLTAKVRYGGQPVVAPNPPWDGGFTWAENADGQPWIAVSCQGEGADLWWPVKDHPSDEPDSMRIALTVPSDLRAIANGAFDGRMDNGDGTATETWLVSTPINNYGVSFGVGPYEEVIADYKSPAGYTMPVTFYVLPERVADGIRQLPGFLDSIAFLERTFGPYGFRRDGYKILHTPYLGMEHQSLIAYGSTFEDNDFGFDWLHFHELAHEWWANLGTAPDWRDFWIHESFANYAEALYAEDLARRNGEDPDAAYLAYIGQVRPNLRNVQPVAPVEPRTTKQMYNLPDGSFNGDIYFKGSWFLHTLRFLMDDDEAFFRSLRRILYPDSALEAATDGSANRFVSTADVQKVFEDEANRDLSAYFTVYLRQPDLPRLTVDRAGERVTLRWHTPEGALPPDAPFELPVEVSVGGDMQRVAMPGGVATFTVDQDASFEIDPDGRILFDDSVLP